MNEGWEGILDPGEKILWQGRPDGGVVFSLDHGIPFLFGLAFAGFALVWMIVAAQGSGGFWLFGLIHFSVGLCLAFGPFLWPAFKRRHSWYTLTDQRAIIAQDIPLRGKSLDSYPIDAHTLFSLYDEPLGTIHFADITRRAKKGTITTRIGFERIPNVRDVYRLMRDIQTKARQKQQDETRDP